MPFGKGHTIHFLIAFQKRTPTLGSHESTTSCFHILYSPHMSPLFPLLTILSQVKVHLLEVYFTSYNTFVPFSIQNILVSSFAISFVVGPHILPPFFFSSLSQLLPLDTPTCSALPPNTWNIVLLLLLSLVSLLLLFLLIYILLPYLLISQIYSGESVFSFSPHSCSYSFRPGVWTFYNSNILFLPFLLILFLIWWEHTVS